MAAAFWLGDRNGAERSSHGIADGAGDSRASGRDARQQRKVEAAESCLLRVRNGGQDHRVSSGWRTGGAGKKRARAPLEAFDAVRAECLNAVA